MSTKICATCRVNPAVKKVTVSNTTDDLKSTLRKAYTTIWASLENPTSLKETTTLLNLLAPLAEAISTLS